MTPANRMDDDSHKPPLRLVPGGVTPARREEEGLVAADELAEGVVVPDEEGGDERLLLAARRGDPARHEPQRRPLAFVVHAVRRGHMEKTPCPSRG